MVIGSPGKKIQTIVELAEELYERVTEIRERIQALQATVGDTNDRVAAVETELERQRAVLEAVADRQGIDVDATLDALADESHETEEDAGDPEDADE